MSIEVKELKNKEKLKFQVLLELGSDRKKMKGVNYCSAPESGRPYQQSPDICLMPPKSPDTV